MGDQIINLGDLLIYFAIVLVSAACQSCEQKSVCETTTTTAAHHRAKNKKQMHMTDRISCSTAVGKLPLLLDFLLLSHYWDAVCCFNAPLN